MRFADLGPEIQQLITQLNIPEAALDHLSVKAVAQVYEDLGQAERILREAAAAAAAAEAQRRAKRAGSGRRLPFQDITNVHRSPDTGAAPKGGGDARNARSRSKGSSALKPDGAIPVYLSPTLAEGAQPTDAPGSPAAVASVPDAAGDAAAATPARRPADASAADCLDIACPSPVCSFQLLMEDDPPPVSESAAVHVTDAAGTFTDAGREPQSEQLRAHSPRSVEAAADHRRLERLLQDVQRLKAAKDRHKEAALRWEQRAMSLESAKKADASMHRAEVARLQKQLTARDQQLATLRAVLEENDSKPAYDVRQCGGEGRLEEKKVKDLQDALAHSSRLITALGSQLQGQFALMHELEGKWADQFGHLLDHCTAAVAQRRPPPVADPFRGLEAAIRRQAALLADGDTSRPPPPTGDPEEYLCAMERRAAASPCSSPTPKALTEKTAAIRQRHAELRQLREEREHLVEQVRRLQGLNTMRRKTSSVAMLLAAQAAGLPAPPPPRGGRAEPKASPWKPPGP